MTLPGALPRPLRPREGSPAQEPPLRGGWPPKRACGRSASIVPGTTERTASAQAKILRPALGPLVKGGCLRRKAQTGGLLAGRMPFPEACADWG